MKNEKEDFQKLSQDLDRTYNLLYLENKDLLDDDFKAYLRDKDNKLKKQDLEKVNSKFISKFLYGILCVGVPFCLSDILSQELNEIFASGLVYATGFLVGLYQSKKASRLEKTLLDEKSEKINELLDYIQTKKENPVTLETKEQDENSEILFLKDNEESLQEM